MRSDVYQSGPPFRLKKLVSGLDVSSTDRTSRNTSDYRERRYIMRHNGAGTDDSAVANGDPGKDDRTRSDPDSVADADGEKCSGEVY